MSQIFPKDFYKTHQNIQQGKDLSSPFLQLETRNRKRQPKTLISNLLISFHSMGVFTTHIAHIFQLKLGKVMTPSKIPKSQNLTFRQK